MRTVGAFWRASAHTLAVSAASVLLGLLTSVVVARALGPEAKGQYDLVMATAGLLTVALGFALPAGATYAVAAGIAAARPLLRVLLVVGAVQGVVAAVLVAAVRDTPIGPAFVTPGLPAITPVLIGLFVAVTVAGLYSRAVLMGRERVIEANWCDLAGRMATTIAVVVGALGATGQIASAAAISVISATFVGAIVAFAVYLLGALPHLRAGGPTGIGTVARFAFPLGLANLVQFLNYRMDLFLVALFLGPAQVALYALAGSVAQLIWLVSRSSAAVLLPRVAASYQTEWEATAHHSASVARITFGVSAIAGVCLAAISWLAVPLVYGDQFSGAVPAILWLLPGVVILAPVNVISSFVAGVGHPRMNLMASTLGFIVTLVLDLVLIPTAGIVGAAAASTVSYATTATVMILVFRRLTGMTPATALLPTPADAYGLLALIRRVQR